MLVEKKLRRTGVNVRVAVVTLISAVDVTIVINVVVVVAVDILVDFIVECR